MSRIGIMLRGVLRWLGERLPRRIAALLKPGGPAEPAPMTMAESREQALAAWEQLVSQHAPQLLRESAHERHRETTLQWPRMKPFGTSRQRGWPADPGEDMPAPACAPQHRQSGAPESSHSRAWEEGEQPPDSGRNPQPRINTAPEPSGEPSFQDPIPAERAGITHPVYRPTPLPASTLGHSGWRKPVATKSTAGRGHSPETAPSAYNPGACDRRASPTPETAANKRGYGAPNPEPPFSYQRGGRKEATEPRADPRHRASTWLDIPMPEANRRAFEHGAPDTTPAHTRADPWPDLPESPWSSLTEEPRPGWTEPNRHQRLFDEQRGVL